MMTANWSGRALVGTWEKPVAEHVLKGMQKAGLMAALMPASGGGKKLDDDSYTGRDYDFLGGGM